MATVASILLILPWLSVVKAFACPSGHVPSDRLTAVIANDEAFCMLDDEQSVRTFGNPNYGGALSTHQRRYTDVQKVITSGTGFGLLHRNLTVTVLGQHLPGKPLDNVKDLQANDCAFAALHYNGSVTAWGDSSCGGGADDLSGSWTRLLASSRSFAGITDSGSYRIWGSANSTGHVSVLPMQMLNETADGFAIETADGSIFTVSDNSSCPVTECVAGTIAPEYKMLTCATLHNYYCVTNHTFPPMDVIDTARTSSGTTAIVTSDHRLFTWGSHQPFGPSVDVSNDVRSVVATLGAFAALMTNGDVVVWGDPNLGGQLPPFMKLRGFHRLVATDGLFGALATDGRLVVWGEGLRNGVEHSNVSSVQTTSHALLALQGDEQLLVIGSIPYDIGLLKLTSTCVACPEDTYAADNALSCSPCAESRWSTIGSSECNPCTFGICDDQLLVMLLVGIVPFTICACTFCHCRKTEAELLLEV